MRDWTLPVPLRGPVTPPTEWEMIFTPCATSQLIAVSRSPRSQAMYSCASGAMVCTIGRRDPVYALVVDAGARPHVQLRRRGQDRAYVAGRLRHLDVEHANLHASAAKACLVPAVGLDHPHALPSRRLAAAAGELVLDRLLGGEDTAHVGEAREPLEEVLGPLSGAHVVLDHGERDDHVELEITRATTRPFAFAICVPPPVRKGTSGGGGGPAFASGRIGGVAGAHSGIFFAGN